MHTHRLLFGPLLVLYLNGEAIAPLQSDAKHKMLFFSRKTNMCSFLSSVALVIMSDYLLAVQKLVMTRICVANWQLKMNTESEFSFLSQNGSEHIFVREECLDGNCE